MEYQNQEQLREIEKDTEITARLLGSLGLVDASLYSYNNPEDAPNIFRSLD